MARMNTERIKEAYDKAKNVIEIDMIGSRWRLESIQDCLDDIDTSRLTEEQSYAIYSAICEAYTKIRKVYTHAPLKRE